MPRSRSGILLAILAGLLASAYVGAYTVMVRPVRLIGYTAETLPEYSLREERNLVVRPRGFFCWHTLFAPIHAIDRRLRPSIWNTSPRP